MLVDRGIAEEEDLTEQADGHSTFSSLPGEHEDATPYFLTFKRGQSQVLTDELYDGWLVGAASELERASASPYKNSHNPLLVRAAMDSDYRIQLLEDAFE